MKEQFFKICTKYLTNESSETENVYEFNQGACTRKDWFDCSCCPTNVIRFIPSLPGLIYSKTNTEIYVNLYASNNANLELGDNNVQISQKTNYPWEGNVTITVNPEKASKFSVKLRVPGWARNEVLSGDLYDYLETSKTKATIKINGELAKVEEENGYFKISRVWKPQDIIELNLPMEVKEVITSTKVEENKGKVALEYGPIVYAIEEIDNKKGFDSINISSNDTFEVTKEDHLLEGVNTIQNSKLKAIPYYAWSNRGIGKMKVWIDYNKKE